MYLINLQGNGSINEQIKSQIMRFIELGVLKADDKLPSVRMLAQDLGINPNTVAKAYAELEEEGIIYTINKKGVYVASADIPSRLKAQGEVVIRSLKEDGITKEELLKIVDSVYEEDENA